MLAEAKARDLEQCDERIKALALDKMGLMAQMLKCSVRHQETERAHQTEVSMLNSTIEIGEALLNDEIQKFQRIAEEKGRKLKELEDRNNNSAQQYQLRVHQWCDAYAKLLKRHQELETVSRVGRS